MHLDHIHAPTYSEAVEVVTVQRCMQREDQKIKELAYIREHLPPCMLVALEAYKDELRQPDVVLYPEEHSPRELLSMMVADIMLAFPGIVTNSEYTEYLP